MVETLSQRSRRFTPIVDGTTDNTPKSLNYRRFTKFVTDRVPFVLHVKIIYSKLFNGRGTTSPSLCESFGLEVWGLSPSRQQASRGTCLKECGERKGWVEGL